MASLRSVIFKKIMNRAILRTVGTSIEEKRRTMDRASLMWTRVPKNCMVEKVYIEGIEAEWLTNKLVSEDKVLLYFHGGAYTYGSTDSHRALAGKIGKAAGVRVLLPEYRLAPENPYPAAIEDAVKIYKWLLEQGFESSNIFVAGDSAGGGLSLVLALVLKEEGIGCPASIICLSPWVDLTSSGGSYTKKVREDPLFTPDGIKKAARVYAGNEPLTSPFISPVYADLTGLPPLFIQVGSEELLLSDAEMLAAQARRYQVRVNFKVWQGMWHVWQLTGDLLPEAKQAIAEIGDFVKRGDKVK
ncbi:alpha/beta hydrolase [Neobacillus cucumis]|uniref:alpha/beta hydrolase n=1 Tax=Neobacillus cucumis TaxID=1740721 RepID=UPI0018DF3ACA|nr:alpha/beta hydrolase [Neobacillus cucumis]MBI0577154.1 alpha/beta hydrolase [Neobacillus cucumis]